MKLHGLLSVCAVMRLGTLILNWVMLILQPSERGWGNENGLITDDGCVFIKEGKRGGCGKRKLKTPVEKFRFLV